MTAVQVAKLGCAETYISTREPRQRAGHGMERLLRQALTIRETALGADHAEVGKLRRKLGALLRELGRPGDAEAHIANRGREQAMYISPMRDAIDKGLVPTNHTDFVVAPLDQMFMMWSAVNRLSRGGEVIVRPSLKAARLAQPAPAGDPASRAGRAQHAVAHQELIHHIPVAAEQIRTWVIPLHQRPHEVLQMTGPGVPHPSRVSCAQRIFLYRPIERLIVVITH